MAHPRVLRSAGAAARSAGKGYASGRYPGRRAAGVDRPAPRGSAAAITFLTPPLRTPRLRGIESWLAAVTRFSLRHRLLVVACWLAVAGAGVAGALNLSAHLQSGFGIPGTDSARVEQLLAAHYRDGSGTTFVLVARGSRALAGVRADAARAAARLPGGVVTRATRLPSGAAAAFVQTRLDEAHAEPYTPTLRTLLPGVAVTGGAAIEHDLGPVLSRDLRVGELYLAVPAALAILLLVFGTGSALLPFLFAAATVPTTLGLAWVFAHALALNDYLLNMVSLVGLGIAIDYSLLIVSRYRDERRAGTPHDEAVAEALGAAAPTVFFSGTAVAAGLVLMLALPVPFLRGFGLGGLLIPVVSVGCALTLMPVLLSVLGGRLEAARLLPHALADRRLAFEYRLWAGLATRVMRRAKLLTVVVSLVLVACSLPLVWIEVGPGSAASLPASMPSIRGLDLLEHGSGRAALDPLTVLIDRGTSLDPRAVAAAAVRLEGSLRRDPEVQAVLPEWTVDRGRFMRIDVYGRHDSATTQAQALGDRVRSRLIPAARFPRGTTVLAGGGGASASDFVSRTLGSFPWLVLAVLAISYLLLVRAFRSLLLPLKAVLMNVLTVAAASGLMIAVFQWGLGGPLGFLRTTQIEGWVPVFMFTLLFGLSMDYDVFLVSRMREAWDAYRSTHDAVVHGLSSTGRIVSAAGLIMCATFSGFLLGSIGTMQQLGFGLSVAILIDITLVRALLLPAAMTLAGRWNWYLPGWTARLLRVPA